MAEGLPNARGRRTADEPEPNGDASEKKYGPLYVALIIAGLTSVAILLYRSTRGPDPRPDLLARHVVMQLEVACETHNMDWNQHPWPRLNKVGAKTRIDPVRVYAELSGKGKINTTENYLARLEPRFVKGGQVVDNWGNPLQIRIDPNSLQPVIWSTGRNGKDETNDGTSTNPAKLPKTYYWFGKGDTGDDLWNR
jgi:hypothetical protein